MSKIVYVNNNIMSSFVKLVLEDGNMHGEVPIETALQMAEDRGLDLVEVSPSRNGSSSICKILDYGRLKYEKSKNKKRNKKVEVVKEIRFGINISDHDLEVKNKKVLKFLVKKYKVRYILFLKGREKQHISEAEQKINDSLKNFDGFARWDKVQFSGNYFSTLICPLK